MAAPVHGVLIAEPANDASARFREAENWAAFYREALDEAAIVAVTDTQGTIRSVNRKFCELSGYSEAELIGANHRILRSGFHDPAFFRDLYRTIARGRTWHGEICNRAKDGELYWVDTTIVPHRDLDGRIKSYTAIRFDITPQKQAEERLWRLANVDSLTGLPNRMHFLSDLEMLIGGAGNESFAVGLIDVDNFKDINDSLGHAAGDELLKELAQRVQQALDPDDILARLGGDEFALVLRQCPSRSEKTDRIRRIYEALDGPLTLNGEIHRLGVSIGVTHFPEGGRSPGDLLKHADIALYAAKAQGRNSAVYFSDAMREGNARRAALQSSFEHGLLHQQLVVHYQPIVPIEPGEPVKLEALLRWQHPERGLLSPAVFREAMDDERLVALADRQVLKRVLADIAIWRERGVVVGSVAVNAALGDFKQGRYVEALIDAVRSGQIVPEDVCVEITEDLLIGQHGDRIRTAIELLDGHGFRIAFDDFGTGYASLSHLRDLPVDLVKIDRSFIKALGSNPADHAIVESVILLSHRLGKRVVAEGVETKAQARILRDLGCDYVQGFVASKPLPFAEVEGAIARLGKAGLTASL
ncbi:MAG: putative bifunctional diguanylate cyclase/phosphodiesterase [Alphaproteobacteria bacterium]